MLRLEHVNLAVSDIGNSLKFYQAAMPHWQVRGEGIGGWSGTPRRWLHFGDEYTYLALHDDVEESARQREQAERNGAGLVHFGLEVSHLAAVIQRLEQAGFTPSDHGSQESHRRNIYFMDPDGFEVEFVEYLSDAPAERNVYG
jgi:catechol 2,3-dioxygenase-like lactoylglutathione lyase family enzyme